MSSSVANPARWAKALCLAAAFITGASATQALEVAPARLVIEAPGIGARGKIVVRNSAANPVPIEITVDRRWVDENGASSYSDADADFVVFPPQALLRPGSGQSVQFQYVGEPFGDQSRAYVIRVTEIPVEDPGGVGVQVVYEFGVALYIAPPGTRAEPVIDAVQVLGGGRYEVTVRNAGRRHAILGGDGLQGIADARGLLPDGVGEKVTAPIVPPGSVRRFIIGAER